MTAHARDRASAESRKNEIHRFTQSDYDQFKQVSGKVDEVSTSIEQMIRSVTEMARNVQGLSEAAERIGRARTDRPVTAASPASRWRAADALRRARRGSRRTRNGWRAG